MREDLRLALKEWGAAYEVISRLPNSNMIKGDPTAFAKAREAMREFALASNQLRFMYVLLAIICQEDVPAYLRMWAERRSPELCECLLRPDGNCHPLCAQTLDDIINSEHWLFKYTQTLQ